jgi:hypothetical protein
MGEGYDATLYSYVWNDPVDYYDPDGLTAAAAGGVLAGGGVLVLGEEGGTLGLGTPVAILTGLGVLGLAGYELLQPGATPTSCNAQGTGERNIQGGDPNPWKGWRPDPSNPGKGLKQDPQTGKWKSVPRPPGPPPKGKNW